MRIRKAHEIGSLIREARKRRGWSQTQLADAARVSRQWISLVENGKSSMEFDMVLNCLTTLEHCMSVERIEPGDPRVIHRPVSDDLLQSGSSQRTSLTKGGKPLGHRRSR